MMSTSSLCQFGAEHLITEQAYSYPRIESADLDGDGDYDILLAGSTDISWFENLNGSGVYGEKQVIASPEPTMLSNMVSSADLDGDGDLDVLSSFYSEIPFIDIIMWNENLDGEGTFGPDRIISSDIYTVYTIIGTDIDGDNDSDVMIVERNPDRVAWFENLSGTGGFSSKITISNEPDWPTYGEIGDIDNDGDIDILIPASQGNNVGWFKNLNGEGSFSGFNIISNQVNRPFHLSLADIDMDGDLDVVSTSRDDNKVAWYENLDGLGAFGPQIIITQELNKPYDVCAADLDNDGDMDIVTSYFYNVGTEGAIVWIENLDGFGSFGEPQIVTENVGYVSSIQVDDIDLDGDIDIIAGSHFDNKVVWYENLTILNVDAHITTAISIYPNPVEEVLTIANPTGLSLDSIALYDTMGRKVSERTEVSEQVAVSHLSAGVYFLHVVTDGGAVIKRVVKE